MRIGYEAKRAFLNMTGLGNYSRGVIGMMALNYPENDYFLYSPKAPANSRVNFIRDNKRITTVTAPYKLFASLWRSKFVVDDLKQDGIELYHGLSHELPIGIRQSGIKSIVTVHDLIFKRFPQYFGFVSRKIYSAKINYACRHADRIIAISEKTKADLVALLNVDAAKIEVIYQDCDESFKIEQSDEKKAAVKAKYNLPVDYILSIGTIEERKNLLLLIKALELLPTKVKLVVIGKQTGYAEGIKRYISEHGLADRIMFVANVSFIDLPAIYQSAQIFVYPSRYEGFGIPILEALVSGTPVIAATGSCLEEAGGPHSIYVDPDDEADLAEKIGFVLSNKSQQQIMIENGRSYARNFEDKKLAAQLMALYQNVLNHA